MKQNYVLIDYENIQPVVAEALASPVFKVLVFVGANQSKVKFDLVDLLQRKGEDAKIIKMRSSGHNALDFHMSFYLGKLSIQYPDAYFHLIAADTGMDPLIGHLVHEGVAVARYVNVFDIPIVKAPATGSDDDKYSRVIEYLVRRGKQRPATLKTLIGSSAALFQPKLGEAEAAALVDQLQSAGVFEVVGSKLKYGLPD